jgi:hypothetical protein
VDTNKRAVRIRIIWSLVCLLAAALAFIYVDATYSVDHGIRLISDTVSLLLILASGLVVASGIFATRAVAAGNRGVTDSRRAIRVRSLDALIFLLVALVVLFPSTAIEPEDWCSADRATDYTICQGRPFGLGLLLLLVLALLLVVIIVFTVGAIVAGVSSAAKSGRRGWMAGMLGYLLIAASITILSILALAQKLTGDPRLQAALAILIFAPLLTPIITFIYSLTGGNQRVST